MPKTIKVGNQECLVQTLREWVNQRIVQIRRSLKFSENRYWTMSFTITEPHDYLVNKGRESELVNARKFINKCVDIEKFRPYLNDRITWLRIERRKSETQDSHDLLHWTGALSELMIIREKMNDGRIQGVE